MIDDGVYRLNDGEMFVYDGEILVREFDDNFDDSNGSEILCKAIGRKSHKGMIFLQKPEPRLLMSEVIVEHWVC